MKKMLIIFLGSLAFLLSHNALAGTKHLTACFDCNQTQAKNKFLNELDDYAPAPINSSPRDRNEPSTVMVQGYVYTGDGTHSGYYFVGRIGVRDKHVFTKDVSYWPQDARDIFNQLDRFSEAWDTYLNNVRTQLMSLSAPQQNYKGFSRLGDCPSGMISPFTYFGDQLAYDGIINAAIQDNYTPINIEISGMSETVGADFGVTLQGTLNQTVLNHGDFIPVPTGNGGQLGIRINQRTNPVSFDIVLDHTYLGQGFTSRHGEALVPETPISLLVQPDGGAGFVYTGYEFNAIGPCLQREIEIAMEDLADDLEQELDDQTGELGGGIPHCEIAGQSGGNGSPLILYYVFEWTTFVDGVLTVHRRIYEYEVSRGQEINFPGC